MTSLGRPLGSPQPKNGVGGWILALVLLVRSAFMLTPIALGFLLVSALGASFIESDSWRLVFAVGIGLGLPLLASWRLKVALANRKRLRQPSLGWLVAAVNALLALVLAFGFADDMGRNLRRRGDWFLGERNGWVSRQLRSGIGALAMYLEKFDPPAELAPIVIPADPESVPFGPWRPGEKPPVAQPTVVAWFHPLAGPRRALPLSAGRRFGAERPQPRPAECDLGHCGVDLGTTIGEPVFAAFDGVVERIERDEDKGGRAGRYVRLGHRNGSVVTRYIHLDTIRNDLKVGDHIKGGELVGRLGRSGVHNSGAHLHFGLSLRGSGASVDETTAGPDGGRASGETYIDPEPYLRRWQLVDASKLSAVATR